MVFPSSPSIFYFILVFWLRGSQYMVWVGSWVLWPSYSLWKGALLLNEIALNKFQFPRCHLFCGLSVHSLNPFLMGFWRTFLCCMDNSTYSPCVPKPVSALATSTVVTQSSVNKSHCHVSTLPWHLSVDCFVTMSDPEDPGFWYYLMWKWMQYGQLLTVLLQIMAEDEGALIWTAAEELEHTRFGCGGPSDRSSSFLSYLEGCVILFSVNNFYAS